MGTNMWSESDKEELLKSLRESGQGFLADKLENEFITTKTDEERS